ncbi:MAG: amylo-alpha-1,6-glucosidase, partial [Steroidobacteraceae bacterium]
FWMADQECFCLALERDGRQVSVVSSNAGQVLWSGIAAPELARKTAERLFHDDMFSGWGVRTLSAREVRYNPLAYQLGSIWPFDNSLILAGLRRHGCDDLACRVFRATLDAAIRFGHGRLPEFFAGTARQTGFSPARCPRADPLQAWSSGAIPFMTAELLGLRPDGFADRLRIVRPCLPEPIERIELEGLKVGSGTVDLLFRREAGGDVTAQARNVRGELSIEVERVESRTEPATALPSA